MSTTDHADLEALSAFVDGEAPEWADHVAACAECRATAARLRAVGVAVGAPVTPPSAADRDRAIAAAVGTAPAGAPAPASAGHEAERARFARRRSPRPWAMPAAAAVVVGLLGLSGLVLSADRSTDDSSTLAGPAVEADAKAESGVAAAAPDVPPSDLGDIPDAATLRARAMVVTSSAVRTEDSSSSASSGAAASSVAGGGSGAGGSAANLGPPTTTLSQRSITPNVVGTRPCEEQARAREPNLGPVTYFATARQGEVPAYVLGFSSGPSVTLLLLAQNGCGELLRSAGP